MRVETAIKRKNEGRTKVRDMYSRAKFYGPTSSQMNDEFSQILGSLGKVPNWVREYLLGYRDCLNDSLYENNLVFGGFIGEVFYSTHRNRPDYYQTCGIEPSEFAETGKVQNLGHYWNLSAGTKPYFVKESE